MMIFDSFLIFFASMLPLVELRLGMIFGYLYFDLPILYAAISATLGNLIAVLIFYHYLPQIEKYLERFPRFKKYITKIFAKTHKEHSKKFIYWGEFFLVMFIALPIPGSGGWSGAILAFLFDLPRKEAFKFLTLGVIVAGFVMSFLIKNTDLAISSFLK